MDFLNAVAGWAKSVWGTITGAAADIPGAIAKVWHYITSVHGLLSWLFAGPHLSWILAQLAFNKLHGDFADAVTDVLARLAAWVKVHYIDPAVRYLNQRITNLFAWTVRQLWATWLHFELRYRQALAYANRLVTIERNQRIAAVAAEHKAMLAGLKATLAEVQKQASSGYNTGTSDRKTTIQRLLDDLALKDPAVRGLVADIASIVVDIDTIDNPVARFILQKLLNEIIGHLGIDQAVTGLIQRLLGPLAGQPVAHDLYGVEKDVAARLGALEAQWAEFMTDGGPEVEQAGKEWKDLTSVITNAALLAFFGAAVTEPAAWATSVADTIGTAANGAMTGIVDLINAA